MAKRPGNDDGMLPSPTMIRNFSTDLDAGDADCGEGAAEDVSLEEILNLYSQPINEEQAWAVCYQCCRTLAQKRRKRGFKSAGASAAEYPRRIEGPEDVVINRDGTVKLPDKHVSVWVIDSLGIMIYKALDFGLKDNEERELSPPLERLIDMMTNMEETKSDPCPDEGYEATEEEEEEEEEDREENGEEEDYRDIIAICSSHLPSPLDAPNHYQAVCRALYAETRELRTFLEKIKSAKENLRRMEGETHGDPVKDLNELENADWARFWVQVMRDLRNGVKLKKVQERQYNPLPIEYQLTPYEMLMDDIRSKRYKLRKVMVNGDIPPRLKKSAHEIILEFIRSRPPLNPVAARKLKPHPQRPQSLHERLLEDIKTERKLRPVSPDLIRRHRLGAGKSISTPQDLFRSPADSPDAQRKLTGSTQSLAGSSTGTAQGVQPQIQRKRLLKAPALAELDSSESDEETTQSSSSKSTSFVEDASPEPVVAKKVPPKLPPVSAPPQPETHQQLQRRRCEKVGSTAVCPFLPLSRQSGSIRWWSGHGEEFSFPKECLALTVEEVMHIRQVLVKAELEKFQQYKDVYSALKKGKICFCCRNKKFSLFTWSYVCQFCKRPVCAQCSRKMRLPSKPYATLPIYSLGLSTASKESSDGSCAPAESEKHPSGSGYGRHSLRRRNSSKDAPSQDELELPKELTEDWVTMEVCVDCKKFITDTVTSSRRSLSVASKRARINRKTQSFYMSSSRSINFMPSEGPISEV
uniref:Spire-type actin nucleation factor 1a n=1 Tax=Nothobranchius furzeri TaxID=105023 RepID=A0A8C6NX56_NOTFU